MGRKKQKVRWTSVEEGFFINENDESEVMYFATIQKYFISSVKLYIFA